MNNINNKVLELTEMLSEAASTGIFPGGNFALVCEGGTFTGSVGKKRLFPEVVENDINTMYDMASCSKVVSTTTCILKLLEQGKLRLFDTVKKYLPRFRHENVLVWDLITHTSGLPAGVSGVCKIKSREEALDKIYALDLIYEKNTKIVYSDIGFILLGFIVEEISGMKLNEFAKKYVFEPLEMYDTGYNPVDINRCAPTEERNDDIVKGIVCGKVHDEMAYILGGVCGHAGLFSTCKDMSHLLKWFLMMVYIMVRRFYLKLLLI